MHFNCDIETVVMHQIWGWVQWGTLINLELVCTNKEGTVGGKNKKLVEECYKDRELSESETLFYCAV